MMNYLFIFLLGGLILMTTTSCSKKNQQKHTHHLHLNFLDGDVHSLHPHHLAPHIRGLTLGGLLFEGLTRTDNSGKTVLAGAEKMEISQDQKHYLFTLRNQKWSDGSLVTADHYVSAWKSALSPQADCPRADLLYIIKNARQAKRGEITLDSVGVRALDSKTLAIDLEYSSPHFLKLIAHPVFLPLKTTQGEPVCFNGPFAINNWKKGVKMQLSVNPHFWNRNAICLKDIEIDFIMDSESSYHLFEKGEIDWIGPPINNVTTEQKIKLTEAKKALHKPLNRYYWTYLNTKHPVLKSLKIRQALSYAIDRRQITDHIFLAEEPLFTPVQPSMIPPPELPKQNITVSTLIQEGLEELGLTLETAPQIGLSYAHCPGFKILAEYLKNCWESATGLRFELQGAEWNIFRHNLDKGEFAIASCYQSAIYDDPLELFERFEELGTGNWPQWENPLFKETLVAIREEIDEEKQKLKLQEAEKILMEQVPFIPICRAVFIFSHNPNLKNYVLDTTGSVDFAYATFDTKGNSNPALKARV